VYNTVQKTIPDPINNKSKIPVVIIIVVDDASSLLLVGNMIIVGVILKEPFEVDSVM